MAKVLYPVALALVAFGPHACQAVDNPATARQIAEGYYEGYYRVNAVGARGERLGNRKAFELAKKNIALHTSANPTLDNDGRIVAVALRDDDPKSPGENALLSAWLTFPHAYDDPHDKWRVPEEKRFVAAFGLFLKNRGFKPDLERTADKLTASEALRLDCLTVLSCLNTEKNDIKWFDPFARAQLKEAVGRLSKRLGGGTPEEVVTGFKKLSEGDGAAADYKLFRTALDELAWRKSDDKAFRLTDSFEVWFGPPKRVDDGDAAQTLRYAAALGDRIAALETLDAEVRDVFLDCVKTTLGRQDRGLPLINLLGLLHRPARPGPVALKEAFLRDVEETLPAALPSRPVQPGAHGKYSPPGEDELITSSPERRRKRPAEDEVAKDVVAVGTQTAKRPEPHVDEQAEAKSAREKVASDEASRRAAEAEWQRERIVYAAVIGLLFVGLVFLVFRLRTTGR